MKIFNNHAQQVYHYDYVEPTNGVVTKYVVKPGLSKNLPEPVAKFFLEKFPHNFSTDEEAQAASAIQKRQIEERDETIAKLTERALKAELALEALATKAEAEAVAETAEPGAKASEVKRGPGRPRNVVTPVSLE